MARAKVNDLFWSKLVLLQCIQGRGVEIASQIGIARSDITLWVYGLVGACKHCWCNLAPECCGDGLFCFFV